jgi:hypothetical protein
MFTVERAFGQIFARAYQNLFFSIELFSSPVGRFLQHADKIRLKNRKKTMQQPQLCPICLASAECDAAAGLLAGIRQCTHGEEPNIVAIIEGDGSKVTGFKLYGPGLTEDQSMAIAKLYYASLQGQLTLQWFEEMKRRGGSFKAN